MTREEKLAYARGYSRGARWPLHRPPQPPNAVIAEFMAVLIGLRNAVDGELANLDPDDEWTDRLGPKVDAVDAVLMKVGEWLKSADAETEKRE